MPLCYHCRRAALVALAGLALSVLSPAPSHAAPAKDEAKRKVMTMEALRILQTQDSWAVVEQLARRETALAATRAFGDLMHHFYERKDLPMSLAFGRAGVQHGLTTAARIERDNPALAAELREAAWAIAYDVAANAWPGWGEAGITVTPADLAIGRDAARANLRLTGELKKGPLEQSRGQWIVGAYCLAAGDLPEARETFAEAARLAAAAKEKGDELLNVGYQCLVDVLAAPGDAAAGQRLDEAKKQLKTLGEDGAFFVEQLDTARRVFVKR